MTEIIHLLKPISIDRNALADLGRILVATASIEFIDATRVRITINEEKNTRHSRELARGENAEISLEVFLREKQ